eukprot:jgi/Bigna1/128063/aug1.5_g2771
MLNVLDAASSFVESLCKFALPTSRNQPQITQKMAMPKDIKDVKNMEHLLSPKHILVLKALLSIAHNSGTMLGPIWMGLLRTFHTMDQILRINAKAIQIVSRSKPGGTKDTATNVKDLEALKVSLEDLFSSSHRLTDEALSHLMSALGSLCLTALANAATAEAEYFCDFLASVLSLYPLFRGV